MGNWQTDWSRDALERIVILLFALANLADRAADASFLRRRRVLDILSCGEVEARAFVIGMVCYEPVPADALESSDDAAHLAVRLRALALVLCVMLARRIARPGTDAPYAAVGLRTGWDRPAKRRGCHMVLPSPDTS